MKKMRCLLLVSALLFSASFSIQPTNAEAMEFGIGGYYIIAGQVAEDLNFVNNETQGNESPNGFNIYQRVQINLDIIASENLSGSFKIRAPQRAVWGEENFALNYTGNNDPVTIYHAYIDWYIPDTNISLRMGLQDFTLPGYLGGAANPVVDSTAAGVSIDAAFGDVEVVAQWFRLESSEFYKNSEYDVFSLIVPIQFDSISITPWAAYGIQGKAVNEYGLSQDTYWFGVTSKFSLFDPITFGVDALYSSTNLNYDKKDGTNGWLIDAYASYDTPYGTPALFGWYASGDGYNNGKEFGGITQMKGQGSWGYGGFIDGQSAFFVQDSNGLLSNSGASSPSGTWAIGLSYNGFKPLDKLTIGGHVMYITGTNNSKNITAGSFDPDYLTTKDSVTELAVYGVYDIYKELQAALLINYMIENVDSSWLSTSQKAAGEEIENAFRTSLSFKYTF